MADADIVRQRPAHGAFSRHCVAFRFADQRHARHAELALRVNLETAGQAGRFAACPVAADLGVACPAIRPRHARVFGIGTAEFRMVGGAMVALAVVFPDELPVTLFDDGALMRDLGFPDAVWRHVALHFGAHGLKIRRLIGEADEDVASDGFAGDRLQAKIALVELLAHVAGK